MSQTLRSAFNRVLRLPNRRTAVRRGRLEAFPFKDRQITVYLPPGYDERDERRYPVLYMQDGQNLFDPARAFAGQPWKLNEAADAAIGERTARPMIIVGVDHANADRIHEYTPTRDEAKKGGGKAAEYARMLVDEIKQLIDSRYRTLADREHTAIGGSSLGGLVSLYLAMNRPDVFGHAAVVSPSVWWDNRVILDDVGRFAGPDRPRIWLDIGGREGREALIDVRLLYDRLRAKGWRVDETLHYFEDRRADHSERAWASRARKVLEFLFPPA